MKRVPLGKNGKQGMFTLVDDEDYDCLNKFTWHAQKHRNTFYVIRTSSIWSKEYKLKLKHTCRKSILIHRVLLNAKDGEQIDHIDGNGLNNQKENLRICNNSQNAMNKVKPNFSSITSKYKGVSKCKIKIKRKNGTFYYNYRWKACIQINGKRIKKILKTEIEAAIHYNKLAAKYFGEFARYNLIPENKEI